MNQSFSQAKLHGRSFKNQDMTGVDFSYADIRGANFTNAILKGANLSFTKTGLQHHWVVGLVIITFLLAVMAGAISGYAGAFLVFIGSFKDELTGDAFGGIFLVTIVPLFVLVLFGIVMIRQGIGKAIGISCMAATMGIILVAMISQYKTGSATEIIVILVIIRLMMGLGGIGGVFLGAIALTAAGMISRLIPIIIVGIGIGTGAVAGLAQDLLNTEGKATPWEWSLTFIVTLALLLLSVYVSRQAFKGARKFLLVKVLATSLATIGGTSFRGADLTDATLNHATLKSADFRRAVLTRTNWHQAHKLDQARLDDTYLADRNIRDLVVTKNGHEQTFDRQDLRHLNLEEANLTDASFQGADLSGANLRQANLSRANLTQAQLYRTDFTQATLTGAYIQNWGISIDTELSEVNCDYVYMRQPTKEDPDPCRKPDSRNESFAAGDFTEFISPIIKTLDLYQQQDIDMREVAQTSKSLDLFHNDGLDPSAAAIALKQLAEKFPEAGLEVVALEGRGNEKVRVQARVTGDVDRSELSDAYFAQYQKIESMAYGDIQALMRSIEEKDERIRSLEAMVNNALGQDKYYVEKVYNLGDNVDQKSSSINIQAGGDIGNVNGIVGGDLSGVLNQGEIGGNAANNSTQNPEEILNPKQPGLNKFLQDLQAAIEAESDLEPDDKAEALAQVAVLIQVGQAPQNGDSTKAGTTALKILRGTIAVLPPTAPLVQTATELLPKIGEKLKV